MDHLEIPAGASHIRVPYKCTQFYDEGDFFGYPARQGWTKEQLLGHDKFGGRTDAEVEAFFQNWLYFGTLICIFKLQGIPINPSEFLTTDRNSRKVFVTTSKILQSKIQAWRHRGQREGGSTNRILDELRNYVDRYCGVEGREHAGIMHAPIANSVAWPVAGEITTSIIALGHILGEATRSLCGRADTRLGASPMLKARLLESGWCPLDVRRLLSDVAIDGHYYLTLTQCPYDKHVHHGCNEFSCQARTIDEKTYVIRHAQDKCNGQCKHDMIPKDVARIIENGGIPVVSWRKDAKGGGSRLIVEDAGVGEIIYVAISHVWADGLGNPYKNALPACQLERIQKRVDAVFPEISRHSPVYFWMDTLCILVADEYQHLRKKSIQMMREIYQRAGAVLVFDAGLQKLPFSSSNNEKAMAIYMSGWLHRLWTFQEGMLAQKLYFQLEGGPLSKQDFTDDSVKEQEADQEKGLYGSFQYVTRSAALNHFAILKDMVEMKILGNGELFQPLAHAIQQRATTRISDEAFCGAIILDMDLKDMLAVKKENVPDEVVAAKRMEILFKQIGEFPPSVIFHHQPRLKTEGFRWAPKTIMGAQPMDFARDLNEESSLFTGEGLPVRYPGFILENILSVSGKEITVVMKQDKNRYRLQVFPEDDASPLWDPKSTYAVVMFRSVSASDSIGTDAIIGILKDPAAVRDGQVRRRHDILDLTVYLNCECRAWVEPLRLASPGVSTNSAVTAELLGNEQAWHVF